ncbi:hypothetical protein N9V90_01945, partial [Endozoicomonas sp.]|nr:hypothetical protein [Endozoicomonas sp.]
LLEDTEPFALEGLEQYHLKQELLESLIAGDNPGNVLALQRAKGRLPYGAFGELFMDEQIEVLASTAATIQEQLTHSSPADDIEVNLTISDIKLSGWIKQHRSSGLLSYRASSIKGKDIITGWIKHLCYCATGHNGASILIGVDTKKGSPLEHCFKPLSTERAKGLLTAIITIYLEGLERPLPFFPETSLAWFKDRDHEEKAYKKAKTMFEGNTFGSNNFAESDDPYIARIHPDFDATYDAMTQLSQRIFSAAMPNDEESSNGEDK